MSQTNSILEKQLVNTHLTKVLIYTNEYWQFLNNHNGWQLFDTAIQLDTSDDSSLSVFRNEDWEVMDVQPLRMDKLNIGDAKAYPQRNNIYWNSVINRNITQVDIGWATMEGTEEVLRFPSYILLCFSNRDELLIASVDILTEKDNGLPFKYNPEGELLACLDKEIIKRYLELYKGA